ncbi:8369_t:CDS:1, partial [Funneliformis geosporum]
YVRLHLILLQVIVEQIICDYVYKVVGFVRNNIVLVFELRVVVK